MKYIYITTLLFIVQLSWAAQGKRLDSRLLDELQVTKLPIGGDTSIDSPLGVLVVIKGKKAAEIFKYLKVKPEPAGVFSIHKNDSMKIVGNLKCVKSKKNYWCDFGINLETGESVFGQPD